MYELTNDVSAAIHQVFRVIRYDKKDYEAILSTIIDSLGIT